MMVAEETETCRLIMYDENILSICYFFCYIIILKGCNLKFAKRNVSEA